jgi:hypothetical protein
MLTEKLMRAAKVTMVRSSIVLQELKSTSQCHCGRSMS